MVSLHPDTKHSGRLWGAGYIYEEAYILNLAHIHNTQTAGIPVMPVTGKCMGHLGLEQNKSRFSHDKETVKLGYHKLFLEDDQIGVELTATNRVGLHRYTFPASGEALNGFEFPVSEFLAGGKLEIELGSSPPAL